MLNKILFGSAIIWMLSFFFAIRLAHTKIIDQVPELVNVGWFFIYLFWIAFVVFIVVLLFFAKKLIELRK